MSNLIFLYHLLVVGVLLVVLLNFLLNQLCVPRLFARKPSSTPLVSVLIPARNEEACIERCLRSLQTQDYPNYEIILLDDQSTDRTASIAAELGFTDTTTHHRIISGKPLPAGWVGKPWACHQLSQAARGEYLLFTDADTQHASFSLNSVVADALESGADLLTLWPYQETKTWSEKLVVPILFVAAGGLLPHWLMFLAQKNVHLRKRLTPKQWSKFGAANGQYVFFSKKGYDRIGGHEVVRNHMVEDVSLGRLLAGRTGEGMILRHADGGAMVRTRMYRSFPQLWEGFTKNTWPIFDGNFAAFCIGLSGQLLVFVAPFLWLAFANVSWLMIFFQIVLIYLIRFIFTLRYQSSWLGALAHPFGYLLITGIAVNSYLQNKKAGLTWKGRIYHVET